MALSPRTRLGTYEILGALGAGGMGEVYRAKDLRLGREIAIKVLPADVASSPDRLARLEREARTVAGLNHPNIVTLHSLEDADGIRFLTMELVEGQTLASLVTHEGLPLGRILELSIALTDALVAAHERGVIHRDFKPGNVMVTRDGRVKVLDFGLAKMAGDAPLAEQTASTALDTSLSTTGHVPGTVPYMAPEQLRGEAVDARCDLFALGVVLYELAAGHRPFLGSTPIEVGVSILHDKPEPLTRVRPDLPHDLDRIVGRCLEKDARNRFQTALEVSNELRRLRRVVDHGELDRAATESVVSIAVLPFVNRSSDAEDEYFSDGLADELLNMLAKIKGLRVSARASSFHFKGKDVPLAEVGRVLNVATVLDGSVRKMGNRARISVQLVRISDGDHLWSETYDRTLDDIFAVQDDIAQSVVKELRAALLGDDDSDASGQAKADVAKAAKGRGTDPEAHRLYLVARHFLDRYTREDAARAIAYLKQALNRDPKHALAWAELGLAYMKEADRGWVPVAEGYGQARAAVERALALEPDLAEAHARMGWIRMVYDRDWQGAEDAYRRALAHAPLNPTVLHGAGELSLRLGRFEEAIGLYRRALEQDPLSSASNNNLGSALYDAGRFPEAEAAYRKALELSPLRAGTHAYLSLALVAQGRGADALLETEREPEEWARLWAQVIIHQAERRRAEADAALAELIDKHGGDSAFQLAEVFGARGEVDAAFGWLERAYAQQDAGLSDMIASPHFRALHADPRWSAFLKKIGFK